MYLIVDAIYIVYILATIPRLSLHKIDEITFLQRPIPLTPFFLVLKRSTELNHEALSNTKRRGDLDFQNLLCALLVVHIRYKIRLRLAGLQ